MNHEPNPNYSTVKVDLGVTKNSLLPHWEFPNGQGTHSDEISLDRIGQWVQQVADWERLLRGEQVQRSQLTQTNEAGGARRVGASGRRDGAAVPTSQDEAPSPTGSVQRFLEQIGHELFAAMVSNGVRRHWNRTFRNWRQDPRRVRLLLQMEQQHAERLAHIPFEAICCPRAHVNTLEGVLDSFVLADRVSVARRVPCALDVPSLAVEAPLRVLLCVSPTDEQGQEDELKVDEEVESIRSALRAAEEQVQVEPLRAGVPTVQALEEALGESAFHVFHFIGHGKIERGVVKLLLVGSDGRPTWLDSRDIIRRLTQSPVRLIVLNGCRTAAISVFASQFPAVVGMQFRISDQAALDFARGMYTELAETGQIDDAVWRGRKAICEGQPESRWEFSVPVLYMQSEDGLLIPIKPRILSKELPGASVGCFYETPLQAKGGRKPYEWSVTAGKLPTGLALDATTGRIAGTPHSAGVFRFRATVQSFDGLRAEEELTLSVRPNGGESPPRIVTEKIG